jgi:hypothetical protein
VKPGNHKTKTRTEDGLKSPVAAATILSTKAGEKTVDFAGSLVKWVLIGGAVVVAGAVTIQVYKNRFVKLLQNTNYENAKITQAQASARAETIYKAMYGAGSGFNTVAAQLAGIGFNDFVLIYNAFGKRKPATQKFNPFSNPFDRGWTLLEWIENEFSDSQKEELRFLTSGHFI